MNEITEPNLQTLFERGLQPVRDPDSWTVGKHRYLRIIDQEGALDAQLMYFRDTGVEVLDFDRSRGVVIFKTMAPR